MNSLLSAVRIWIVGALLCVSVPAPARATSPQAVPIFMLSEEWNGSGMPGHRPDRPSYWTTSPGAVATWDPAFASRVRAHVEVFVIAHGNEDAGVGTYTITHAAGVETVEIALDPSETSRTWRLLGEFDFDGGPGQGVTLRKTGGGMYRAAAVRFGVRGGSGSIIQSLVLDTPVEGPAAGGAWEPVDRTFSDIVGHPAAYAIQRLANRGVVGPSDGERFSPDSGLSVDQWRTWRERATADPGTPPAPGERPMPSDAPGERSPRMTVGELRMATAAFPIPVARQGPWLEHRPLPELDRDDDQVATRGDAARVLWWLVEEILEAGPPLDGEWELTFIEEFNGDALDTDVWRSAAGAPGHIMSSRWPENVEVREGFLRLLTRKESRGGRVWTTGNIWTREFMQQYGYFEARLRCGAATGLNNAFWLMTDNSRDDPVHFEIDMTEARHPNQNLVSVHDWAGRHHVDSELMITEESTSDHFHVYAAEWTPTEITFYFNGRRVRTVEHDYCREPSRVRLSSAVGAFAGTVTDALDGTAMEVDYVRVFRRIR
ncbi:MAG: family 16 glycosylhydrolase [Planctomycetota bacterium]